MKKLIQIFELNKQNAKVYSMFFEKIEHMGGFVYSELNKIFKINCTQNYAVIC